MFSQRIQAKLAERHQSDLYRVRQTVLSAQDRLMDVNGHTLLNFCSNDYLGLANSTALKTAAIEAIKQAGVGSGASHLINGHSHYHQEFEQKLAQWLGYPRVLLFSTGFMANTALLQTLLQNNDLLLQDKLNHASLIDGGLHCQGDNKRYRHNDCEHLQTLLDKYSDRYDCRFIASDGVFSMDGDLAPIPELLQLAQQHQAQLIIDDAHGLGVLGEHGKGCLEYYGVEAAQQPILMGTLGKAFGCFGAFVAASEDVIEYLIQLARPYIYTTALPPSVAAAGIAALEIVEGADKRRQQLQSNITLFKQLAQQAELPMMPSSTAIQPLLIGSADKAVRMSQFLRQQQMMVSAIRPPTVAVNSARLRITLTALHQNKDIESLVEQLQRGLQLIER